MTRRRARQNPRRSTAGYTLIGVLVAIIVVTVGLTAILSAQVNATTMQRSSGLQTTSVEIARTYMETLKSKNPTSIVVESDVRVDATGAPSATGDYYRSVALEPGGDGLKKVTVSVTYPGGRRAVELVTLLYHREF